jgi:hypothetical protein
MTLRWKDLPPLSALRAFQAVAEAGGYAPAGLRLPWAWRWWSGPGAAWR